MNSILLALGGLLGLLYTIYDHKSTLGVHLNAIEIRCWVIILSLAIIELSMIHIIGAL